MGAQDQKTEELSAVTFLYFLYAFLSNGEGHEGDEEEGVTAMPKSGITSTLVEKTGLDKKSVASVVDSFVQLATAEVKKAGKFTIPGLCMLKTRIRPARKAGTSTAFGKTIKVKAR